MTNPPLSFGPSFSVFSRLALLLALFLTAACADSGLQSKAEYQKDKGQADMYKHGSLLSDEGGVSLLGGDEKKDKGNNGIGVNGFLWRASLDTVSFMPLASADPFGGVITTDWYTAPQTPGERVKVNILILDRDLRADGVKVTTFRQTKSDKGDWEDASVSPATASSLEETILTRARQLHLANRAGK